MFIWGRKWPSEAILFLLLFVSFNLASGQYENYEGPLPYRQDALDATDLPCGSEVQVNSGDKYLFDSKSAVKYESSLYAMEKAEGENYDSNYRRRRDTTSEHEVEKTVEHQNHGKLTEIKIKEKISTSGRSYGSGGGGGYSHGYGSYSGGRGNNYGHGYSYGGAGGGYHGGNYGYGNAYPGKPAACEWTFFAGDDCSLESHIIKFKPGVMDCYKQQFVISDNYTDFKMCGYQKLYPGFRAETAVLYIKYWRQPYTYRHVFKGYVTCVGRAQRPSFNYTEYYEYVPPTTAAPQTIAHSHSNAQTHSHSTNTGSVVQQHIFNTQGTHLVSQQGNGATSAQQLINKLGLTRKLQSNVQQSSQPGVVESIVFEVKETQPAHSNAAEASQTFTASEVQALLKKMMLQQAGLQSNPNNQQAEQVGVEVIHVQTDAHQTQTHQHQQNSQVQTELEKFMAQEAAEQSLLKEEMNEMGELMQEVAQFHSQDQIAHHTLTEQVEETMAEKLMSEVSRDLQQMAHASSSQILTSEQIMADMNQLEKDQIKIQEAEQLLEAAESHDIVKEQEVLREISEQHQFEQVEVQPQQEVSSILVEVEETPMTQSHAFLTGHENNEQQSESVLIQETETEVKPQSFSLLETKPSLHEMMLAQSPSQEETKSVIESYSNTQNSSPNQVSDSYDSYNNYTSTPESYYAPMQYSFPSYQPSNYLAPSIGPPVSYYPYPSQTPPLYPPTGSVPVIDPYTQYQIDPYSNAAYQPVEYDQNSVVPYPTPDMTYPTSSTNPYSSYPVPYAQYSNQMYGARLVSSENEHEQIAGRSHEETGYSDLSMKQKRPRPPQQIPMPQPQPVYFSPESYAMLLPNYLPPPPPQPIYSPVDPYAIPLPPYLPSPQPQPIYNPPEPYAMPSPTYLPPPQPEPVYSSPETYAMPPQNYLSSPPLQPVYSPPESYAMPSPSYPQPPQPQPGYSPLESYAMPSPSYSQPPQPQPVYNPPEPYPAPPFPGGGYQIVVASPVDPNIHYVVTCQLPFPYPCTPVQSLSAQPPEPNMGMPLEYRR